VKMGEASDRIAAAEASAAEALKPSANPQIGYDAVGQLKISTVYNGNALPSLYRLVDTNDALIAYVRPESLTSPAQWIGKLVGIQGDIEQDNTLGVKVVVRLRKVAELTAGGKPQAK